MQHAKNIKEYRKELHAALADNFLRSALDRFAISYRASAQTIFAGKNFRELIAGIAVAKDLASSNLEQLFAEFKQKAEANGVKVHLARTAEEANAIITTIAKENDCKKIIKSKSMTAEETLLNAKLLVEGCKVVETDLGEWIIQLRGEGPSHMVLPAIHLSRQQISELFSKVTGEPAEEDITRLVRVARRELRRYFVEADMGISGANFALADSGSIGICCNEGNARLVMTLPRVHVALCGLDKLVANMHDAMRILEVLPRNATGQLITSYVNLVTGANECKSSPDNKKIMHVVFLDNGRSELAQDPLCRELLRCIRCGACANVCPVYRVVGGHKMGHIYIGAIGLVLTYFFHGAAKARQLAQNCINCGACKEICSSGIDLPALIQEVRVRLNQDDAPGADARLIAATIKNRKLFHGLLRAGKIAQKPFSGGGPYLRFLPHFLLREHSFRALPTIANHIFRDMWHDVDNNNPKRPRLRVGLFAGCAQDFIYPEQLIAAARVLQSQEVALHFPMEQSCCGLPVHMLGMREATEDIALSNIRAFTLDEYDYIVTLCASCASHLKHGYKRIFSGREAETEKNLTEQFTDKIFDFSSFVKDILKMGPENFNKSDDPTGFHSPCHLCRGMEVTEQPRDLIRLVAEYKPAAEEDVCCGFGGSYSLKFPEVSAATLQRKLDNLEASGAKVIVTDCPGCIIQLRGGEEKRGRKIHIHHTAELLARHLKKKPA